MHAPTIRIIAAAAALCAAGTMVARAAPPPPAADHPAASAQAQVARAGISRIDRRFMVEAAQAGHGLVFASQRVLSRAGSEQVRQYANRMIEQRALLNAELEQLARSKGVVLPLEPSEQQRSKLRLLDKVDGAAFDRRYLDRFGIEAHQLEIRQFEAQLHRGRDPDVKAFARRFLPTLRQHMQEARDLRAAVGGRR